MNISQCKCCLTQRTFAPLKNNYFQIALIPLRTQTGFAKAVLFVSKFPIHTWKISWIERLIYFLWPHMANRSRLTLMNVEKRHVSQNSVHHFFLLLLSSHSILGIPKKCICSVVRLNRSKKKNICLAVRLNCSKKICIC